MVAGPFSRSGLTRSSWICGTTAPRTSRRVSQAYRLALLPAVNEYFRPCEAAAILPATSAAQTVERTGVGDANAAVADSSQTNSPPVKAVAMWAAVD
jgi:hypothetical protein